MREYVDFLGGQPPYDELDSTDLDALARLVEVEFFPAGTRIIEAGESPLSHFYVVRTGEVEVVDRGRVIDLLGSGETFGQISVLSGLPPPLDVRAAEDSLCYRFPDPRPILAHPERLQFQHYNTLVTRERLTRSGLVDQALRAARHQMRPAVWCPAGATVSEAASVITDAAQSYALLDRGGEIGIVTDSDFRRALATASFDPHAPVTTIASFPAESIGADALVGDAFLRMIECGLHHLVVRGGADRPVGVLRVVDLASAEVRNPLVIRRAVDDAHTIDELAAAAALLPGTWVELYDTGVAPMHIAGLLSAVVDALLQRLVELTDIGDDCVPHRTSWLLLGSVARREPLPRSDVDTSLVWEDLPGERNPARNLQRWAGRVLDNMERCGLQRCVDGANATNPQFARSRADAVSTATSWIRNPTQHNALLLSSMIADSRPVTGLSLGRSVSDAMLATTRSREYLAALLRYTVSSRPPVGFVRNFVVEQSGANRGHLDLKARGLVPIASLGRWIAVVTGDDRGSTITRLRRGGASNLLTPDETEVLVQAFEYIYGLILGREIDAIKTTTPASTWVAPNQLDSLTRRYLREAFRAVAEVQNRLESEWVARLP
ncbi:putative nucleotidyltransferase substrate binding domain-containing protein [Rhodococcus sp. T2V]|uniref:putative nucleotidyltransferase substrate binding domain-containing protein n=1 Tax=Rhodococcus sp. T2V TaxID=3034164 RepID=UPI0023E27A79|nr:putative nucleotidyltransferase substrate binding domain-containing protein [Rhodococcus sp. T2V]MDF3306202.1 putative nucleotidyltransferase substrate binding domain-containing protein [Rhodococcus sp. T2V]